MLHPAGRKKQAHYSPKQSIGFSRPLLWQSVGIPIYIFLPLVYCCWQRINPQYLLYRNRQGTPMFLAAMATIAKLWKEPRCPTKDEWIKKLWFMYTMEYYSTIRNDKYPPFASTCIWLLFRKSYIVLLVNISVISKCQHTNITLRNQMD